ncbi:MAG: hypothetical protein HFJ45_00465 [Clostridia bacterium]|nr:hypothetical protein [Clostridia bacterium]
MKGKNLTRILMTILLVLISIAVIIIAFVGIYLPNLNKLKNIIPDYKLGTELDGIIEYRLVVDHSENEKEVYVDSNGNIKGEVKKDNNSNESVEVKTDLEQAEDTTNDTGYKIETRKIKVNNDDALTKENFEKAKSIFEERLERAGATEYAIRLDDVTGNMVVELSQNDDVSYLYQIALSSYGEFDIIDNQTGVRLMDKSHLKNATVVYDTDPESNTYTIYLQLTLDEEGTKLLKEMSKQYIEYTDSEGKSQKDYISIRVDGSSIMTTYFGEEYNQSILNIPISSNVSASDLNSYSKSVEDIAFLLNQEVIPVKYTMNGSALFIGSNFNENIMNIFYWSIVIALVIILIVLFIKFGSAGLLAGILNAALIGLLTLVLKYVKVTISISSMVAFFGVMLLNLIFLVLYLKKLKEQKENAYLETMKVFYSINFPVIVVAFIFTFFVSATVTGLGSVLFWGMLLQIIFNTIITKYVLECK